MNHSFIIGSEFVLSNRNVLIQLGSSVIIKSIRDVINAEETNPNKRKSINGNNRFENAYNK